MGRLRAVFDDGKRHSEGTVRGMWSSGLVLESAAAPEPGAVIALVLLSGGFDGERIAAKVTSVEKGTVMLDLMDLDTARWSRLQALVDGTPVAFSMPVDRPVKPPPPDCAVFILSGGEDDLGDPTGSVTLDAVPAPAPQSHTKAPPPSPFQIPSPLDFMPAHTPGADRSAPPPPPSAEDEDEDLEGQLLELGRRNTALAEENAQLRADVARLQGQLALKAAVEEELADALARLESIEQSLKRSS